MKYLWTHQGFPGGSVVKNPPAVQETLVGALGQEDPLEEGPALVFLPEESHGQRSLAGYSPWVAESEMTEATEHVDTPI